MLWLLVLHLLLETLKPSVEHDDHGCSCESPGSEDSGKGSGSVDTHLLKLGKDSFLVLWFINTSVIKIAYFSSCLNKG